eukprot:3103731-Prorocentrum_lima.AAC.1
MGKVAALAKSTALAAPGIMAHPPWMLLLMHLLSVRSLGAMWICISSESMVLGMFLSMPCSSSKVQ